MENDRKIKIIALCALIISMVGLTVAYASFSTSLKVSGSITAKASSTNWDVHFEALDGTTTLAPTYYGNASGNVATLSSTQLSGFNVNFVAPGDAVEYNFKVVNGGVLDAELTSASIGTLSCTPASGSTVTQQDATAFCNELTMSLTYANGDTISTSDIETKVLNHEDSKPLKLLISWNSASTALISDDINVVVGESTFVYTQN